MEDDEVRVMRPMSPADERPNYRYADMDRAQLTAAAQTANQPHALFRSMKKFRPESSAERQKEKTMGEI